MVLTGKVVSALDDLMQQCPRVPLNKVFKGAMERIGGQFQQLQQVVFPRKDKLQFLSALLVEEGEEEGQGALEGALVGYQHDPFKIFHLSHQ